MSARTPSWVNSSVLMEALHRYEEKRLSRSLRLWVEATLELDPETPPAKLLPHVKPQD